MKFQNNKIIKKLLNLFLIVSQNIIEIQLLVINI